MNFSCIVEVVVIFMLRGIEFRKRFISEASYGEVLGGL